MMSRTAREFMAKEEAACPISRLFPRGPFIGLFGTVWAS